MVERKKATEATPKTEDKDRSKNHIRATVRSLFLSGRKLTAREINMITSSNDARKVISAFWLEYNRFEIVLWM